MKKLIPFIVSFIINFMPYICQGSGNFNISKLHLKFFQSLNLNLLNIFTPSLYSSNTLNILSTCTFKNNQVDDTLVRHGFKFSYKRIERTNNFYETWIFQQSFSESVIVIPKEQSADSISIVKSGYTIKKEDNSNKKIQIAKNQVLNKPKQKEDFFNVNNIQVSQNQEIVFFPNPVTNNEFIAKASEIIKSIEVSNVIGRTVFKQKNKKNSNEMVVSLGNQNKPGLHLVKVSFEGDKFIIKKILVK